MIDGKPLSGAPEATHHLISDQLDAVAVTQGAHALQVACWRNDHAVRAGHCFDHYRSDRLRTFIGNDLFEVVQIVLGKLGFRNIRVITVERGAIAVGI